MTPLLPKSMDSILRLMSPRIKRPGRPSSSFHEMTETRTTQALYRDEVVNALENEAIPDSAPDVPLVHPTPRLRFVALIELLRIYNDHTFFDVSPWYTSSARYKLVQRLEFEGALRKENPPPYLTLDTLDAYGFPFKSRSPHYNLVLTPIGHQMLFSFWKGISMQNHLLKYRLYHPTKSWVSCQIEVTNFTMDWVDDEMDYEWAWVSEPYPELEAEIDSLLLLDMQKHCAGLNHGKRYRS